MREDVPHDCRNAVLVQQHLVRIDGGDLAVLHRLLHLHRVDGLDVERQHVAVPNRVDDRVGVKLLAERLGRRAEERIPRARVRRENRRPRKAEDVVALERLDDLLVQLAELRPVALVENDDRPAAFGTLGQSASAEESEFLDRRDDDLRRRIGQLALQDGRIRIRVRGTLLELVVFADGLVVEVAAVHDEEHLVHPVHARGKRRRLEGRERLATAGRVPDVAAALHRALPLLVDGRDDALENPLRGGDLIGTHHHEETLLRPDAVARQDGQERMLAHEGAGEAVEVFDRTVLAVGPPARELEGIARPLAERRGVPRAGAQDVLADVLIARRVRVVLRMRAVGNDEDLDEAEEARPRPEALADIAVDLVERLANRHAPPLQLAMNERNAVDENRDVIAVLVQRRSRVARISRTTRATRTTRSLVLVNDLQ